MSDPASLWEVAATINRALLYGSMLLALGSLLLLAWLPWPEPARAAVVRQGRFASWVALVACVLALGLAGAAATAVDGEWPLGLAAFTLAAHTSLGPSAAFGACGALLAPWVLRGRSAILLQLVGLLFVASFVVTGHAASAPPPRVAATSVAVHVIAAAFWSAALWPLAAATDRLDARACGALFDAFAARAVGVLLALVVSGLVLLLLQLGPLHNLVATDYGLRLSGKLVAVLVALGYAARNNLSLTPALKRGEADAAAPFRHSALQELAVMALITALAASLGGVEPPAR